MAKAIRARILTPEAMRELRYDLPKSWIRAAGLLQHKRRALERHLRTVRREWERRPDRA